MSVTYQPERIRSDFDNIARLTPEPWGNNSHYHSFLLRQLPAVCEEAVDVGCGMGGFARQLAQRARSVVGIDLSAEMIRLANEQSAGLSNLRFVVADFLTLPIQDNSVDVVASIAALHHVEFEPALRRVSRWLKPGGRLVVLDLFASGYGRDLIWKLPAKAVSTTLALIHNGRIRASREARRAWKEHAERDQLILPLREIREMASSVLPGAIVRQHLLWRYSLGWTKPAER
jgi:ubiquinone/menaquinone biosynthesis C-methylase UbiE